MRKSKKTEFKISNLSVRLRVGRWFPEFLLLTILLCSAGSFFSGQLIDQGAGFSTGKPIKKQKAVTHFKPVPPKAEALTETNSFQETTVSPQNISDKNVGLIVDSLVVKDQIADMTFQIHNKTSKQRGGYFWISTSPNPAKPAKKSSWKAKFFSIKKSEINLKNTASREFYLHLSDEESAHTGSYKIRF